MQPITSSSRLCKNRGCKRQVSVLVVRLTWVLYRLIFEITRQTSLFLKCKSYFFTEHYLLVKLQGITDNILCRVGLMLNTYNNSLQSLNKQKFL